jgi:hypothetical protein
MKIIVLAATLLALTACQSAVKRKDLSAAVSLDVKTFDSTTGKYTLVMRNHSRRDIYFMHFLLAFSQHPQLEQNSVPPVADGALMYEVLKLGGGRSFEIGDTSSGRGADRREGYYAAIYACWSDGSWDCKHYSQIWSSSPIGPRS